MINYHSVGMTLNLFLLRVPIWGYSDMQSAKLLVLLYVLFFFLNGDRGGYREIYKEIYLLKNVPSYNCSDEFHPLSGFETCIYYQNEKV